MASKCCGLDLVRNDTTVLVASNRLRNREGTFPVLSTELDLCERRKRLQVARVSSNNLRQDVLSSRGIVPALQEGNVS